MTRRTSKTKKKPVNLFISYSHVNSAWFENLSPLLKFKMPTTSAYAWHDQELKAGDRWDDEIKQALERMDVFVCLVSYEFLASDYIMDIEVPRALSRNKNDEVEIVPIMLYDVDLKAECPELNAFNPLPEWGKCWCDYKENNGHYQVAHKPIRTGLLAAIDKVNNRR